MTDYTQLRHLLHAHPQTAGNESFAHDTIVEHLMTLHPDRMETHVGGYGVVAVWGHDPTRDTIALRADIDALPIGHRCGHDGHTTILLRTAGIIDSQRDSLRHNVLLVWQPAEETGTGAQAILDSGILQQYHIRAIYGLHNLPGYAAGNVVLCRHTFAAASTGLAYRLQGRPTHASTPELGINPGLAVAEIVRRFDSITTNPQTGAPNHGAPMATLICIRLGSPAFGTSAGDAEIMYTLRAFDNASMQRLVDETNAIVDQIAVQHGLTLSRTMHEPFRATENSPALSDNIGTVAQRLGLTVVHRPEPFRWSEDFANYLAHFPGAMFGIGAGSNHPELHHPDYDFPDDIIVAASDLFVALATDTI